MSRDPVVFVIDDDAAFVDSLKGLIAAMGLTPLCYSCPTEFLERFDPAAPGVILLEERMPRISGLGLLERLRTAPVFPAVVFLTGHPDIKTAMQAMRLGAIDYLQKGCSEAELYEALQRGLAADTARRTEYAQKEELASRFAELNLPEKEVLCHVLKGMVNKQIATLLGISRRTVEDRRARITRKLGVESFAQLVALAMSAGYNGKEGYNCCKVL